MKAQLAPGGRRKSPLWPSPSTSLRPSFSPVLLVHLPWPHGNGRWDNRFQAIANCFVELKTQAVALVSTLLLNHLFLMVVRSVRLGIKPSHERLWGTLQSLLEQTLPWNSRLHLSTREPGPMSTSGYSIMHLYPAVVCFVL